MEDKRSLLEKLEDLKKEYAKKREGGTNISPSLPPPRLEQKYTGSRIEAWPKCTIVPNGSYEYDRKDFGKY